jgi:RNA polymerase sigma factor (sigma-70 family)
MRSKMSTGTPTIETLLEHGSWIRSLARRLASDAEADDVAQETWRAALESPPDPDRPARPWLAQVLRNTVRTAFRSGSRRRAREREVSQIETAPPSAEETLARAQLHQRIAQLVTALDDPYRATVVARFYEGLESTEIARRAGIPAGTVRWRLNEALRRLRAGLDEAHGGDRRRWCALLLLGHPHRPASRPPGTPLIAGPVAKAGLALLLAAGLGGGLLAGRVARRPGPVPTALAPAGAGASSGEPTPGQEDTMTSNRVKRVTTLVGSALPALMAAAAAQAAVGEEAVSWCVEMREKVFACKDEFAEALVARRHPPAEQQMALVAKALEEISEEGSGPPGPRKEQCRQWLARRLEQDPASDRGAKLAAAKKMLAVCSAKDDCKGRVECLLPFLASPTEAPASAPEPTGARPGNGRVVGRVIDAESGAPVPDVEVRVLAMTSQRKLTPRRTDGAGAFLVDGLPAGEPVKIVLVGDRKTYVVERRLLDATGPSLDAGTLRLMRGNLEVRFREGSWRGVTGIVASEDESATVAKVGPGTPAEKAGVRNGDKILAIDGQEVRGLPFGGVEWRLRGRPGSSVAVTIQTGGAAARTVTLARISD